MKIISYLENSLIFVKILKNQDFLSDKESDKEFPDKEKSQKFFAALNGAVQCLMIWWIGLISSTASKKCKTYGPRRKM